MHEPWIFCIRPETLLFNYLQVTVLSSLFSYQCVLVNTHRLSLLDIFQLLDFLWVPVPLVKFDILAPQIHLFVSFFGLESSVPLASLRSQHFTLLILPFYPLLHLPPSGQTLISRAHLSEPLTLSFPCQGQFTLLILPFYPIPHLPPPKLWSHELTFLNPLLSHFHARGNLPF
jgi:hypothetical protein